MIYLSSSTVYDGIFISFGYIYNLNIFLWSHRNIHTHIAEQNTCQLRVFRFSLMYYVYYFKDI